MSPDHLNEKGLAELEEIKIPFSINFILHSSNHIIRDTF